MSCQLGLPPGRVSEESGREIRRFALFFCSQADRHPKAIAKIPKIRGIDTTGRTRYIPFMFGISFEHLVVLGIVLLFFGPRRLPELGNTLGKAIRNFKDALSGVEEAQYRKLQNEESAQQKKTAETPSTEGSTGTKDKV